MSEIQPLPTEELQPPDVLSIQINNVLAASKTFTMMDAGLQQTVGDELYFLTHTALQDRTIRWNNEPISEIIPKVIKNLNTSREEGGIEPYDLTRWYEELSEATGVQQPAIAKSFQSSIKKLWQMVQRNELNIRDLHIAIRREKRAHVNKPGEERSTNPDQRVSTSPASKSNFALTHRKS